MLATLKIVPAAPGSRTSRRRHWRLMVAFKCRPSSAPAASAPCRRLA